MSKKTTFEDHVKIIEAGHQKVAGLNPKTGKIQSSFLDKLAQEMGFSTEDVIPDNTTVAGTDPNVESAMDQVIGDQLILSGGDPVEIAAGEVSAAATPTDQNLPISDGDSVITDANNFSREPEAVAAAAVGGGGDESGKSAIEGPVNAEAIDEEAANIGEKIAYAFQNTLAKQAEDAEYSQALEILKEAGVLEGYNIHDEGIEKSASENIDYLEKISSRQPLTRQDIIGAAYQVVEFEKNAADAENRGREDARALVEMVAKSTEEVSAIEKQASSEQQAIDNLMKDPAVVNAVKVLKSRNII